MSTSSHAARQSISKPPDSADVPILIPYSPHHRAPPGAGHKASGAPPPRSHLHPGTLRRAARLQPTGLPAHPERAAAAGPDTFPPGEAQRLQLAWSWFVETVPQGRLGAVRRNHSFDPLVAPYVGSYSTDSLDWDSLLTFMQMDVNAGRGTRAFGPEASAPRRVLDIGCGITPHWVLHMVQAPGWGMTQFVGLDLAPVVVSNSMLPFDQSNRLSFVQHNFLEGLPFDSARFNLVRISGVALGVPEHLWDTLLEESTRVLAPGGVIEIVEYDFQLVHPPTDQNTAQSFESVRIMQEALDAVYRRRFLNASILSPIRPALAMNCSGTSEVVTKVPFPLLPPTHPSERSQDEARILLHAYARNVEGISETLAEDLASVRIAAQPPLPEPAADEVPRATKLGGANEVEPNNPLDPRVRQKSRTQLEREVMDVVSEWSEELIDRAGVARLVEERWGWECELDKEIEQVLEVHLPVFAMRLREYELEEQRDSVDGGGFRRGEVDPEIDYRRNQVTFAKRDGEVELRAVRKRLGRGKEEESGAQGDTLGTFTLHNWVTRAMS